MTDDKQFDDEAVNAVVQFCAPEIKELRQFALANYDAGGHWVVETYDPDDYARVLMRVGAHDTLGQLVESAKNYLRREWERMVMLEREHAYGDEE